MKGENFFVLFPLAHDRDLLNTYGQQEFPKWQNLRWDQIIIDDVAYEGISSLMIGFTAYGMFYFLPGVLLACINSIEYCDWVLEILEPRNQQHSPRAFWNEFQSYFSAKQRHAVLQFIKINSEKLSGCDEYSYQRVLEFWSDPA